MNSRERFIERVSPLRPHIAEIWPKVSASATGSPDAAIMAARTVVEAILKALHEQRIGPPPKNATIEILRQKLRSAIPRNMAPMVHLIQRLSNLAAHDGTVRLRETEVSMSLEALAALLEWHVSSNSVLERRGHPDEPLCFSSLQQVAQALVQRVWEYPDTDGPHESWAVKESSILRGDLKSAEQKPGLGIALFTTDLCIRVFGSSARTKLSRPVRWGLARATSTAPYLMKETTIDTITGSLVIKEDLRHTIALAILMTRAETNPEHRAHYAQLLRDLQLSDGAWPAARGDTFGELHATSYALEFLALHSRSGHSSTHEDHLRCINAGRWIVAQCDKRGGWNCGILPQSKWDIAWTTAYLVPRYLNIQLDMGANWNSTIEAAASVLLNTSSFDGDPLLGFRILARVAAALAHLVDVGHVPALLVERCDAWLSAWETSLFHVLSELPERQIDLATAAFIASALLHRGHLDLKGGTTGETDS